MTLNRMSNILFFFLLILCGYVLYKVSWQISDLFSEMSYVQLPIDVNNTQATDLVPDKSYAEGINPYHLFGKVLDKKPVKVDTPSVIREMRLNIKLLGIANGLNSVAVVDFSGRQGAFREGEMIKQSPQQKIKLSQIEDGFIVISNNGVDEKLVLPKQKTRVVAKRVNSPELKLDLRSNKVTELFGGDAKKILVSNPYALRRFIQLSPARNQGNATGYRVSPGKDKRLLSVMGLRTDDVITHINAQPVFEFGMEAISALLKNSSLKITLERRGQPINMEIKL